jgi:hypothetical protein
MTQKYDQLRVKSSNMELSKRKEGNVQKDGTKGVLNTTYISSSNNKSGE